MRTALIAPLIISLRRTASAMSAAIPARSPVRSAMKRAVAFEMPKSEGRNTSAPTLTASEKIPNSSGPSARTR